MIGIARLIECELLHDFVSRNNDLLLNVIKWISKYSGSPVFLLFSSCVEVNLILRSFYDLSLKIKRTNKKKTKQNKTKKPLTNETNEQLKGRVILF